MPRWSRVVSGGEIAGRRLTDVDPFIISRLAAERMTLSPPADKETLINRVSLTLTGLPPTLDEVDAFVKDTSPTAYEARRIDDVDYGVALVIDIDFGVGSRFCR